MEEPYEPSSLLHRTGSEVSSSSTYYRPPPHAPPAHCSALRLCRPVSPPCLTPTPLPLSCTNLASVHPFNLSPSRQLKRFDVPPPAASALHCNLASIWLVGTFACRSPAVCEP